MGERGGAKEIDDPLRCANMVAREELTSEEKVRSVQVDGCSMVEKRSVHEGVISKGC